VVDPDAVPASLRDADLRPSRLQRHYHGGPDYSRLLLRMPGAMAHLDLRDFDVVVTSHHAFANRVRPPATTPVVSYTYTPARWLWDAQFRRGERYGLLGTFALGAFAMTQRRADFAAAQRPRAIGAISRAVAERIRRWWGRASTLVPPPVDVERFSLDPTVEREDFFLLAGRLVPYKRPLVAIEAARRAGARLVVVGDGRLRPEVERAAGDGIELRGRVDDEELLDLFRRCRALLFPGEEDFGIVPVEAQATGAPVVALGRGGVLDTVLDGVTGLLYDAEGPGTPELAAAIAAFDPTAFDPAAIRRHSEQFSVPRFREEFRTFVTSAVTGPRGDGV
jgi:glycosyltransferase involved in cell wall biosynthesis